MKRIILVALLIFTLASSQLTLAKDNQLMAQATLPTGEEFYIGAHRGASAYAPENTIAAFELAIEMRSDYIELDVHETKDNVLVAIHDDTVDRTTNGSGKVGEMKISEIKELDAGSWFNETYPDHSNESYIDEKVPTLEEVFRKFGRATNYIIELKTRGIEKRVLDLLQQYKLLEENGRSNCIIIQSFDKESLQIIHSQNKSIPLFQLLKHPIIGKGTDKELKEIKKYAIGIGPNIDRITKQYVEEVRKYNLFIHPYTVDKKKEMKRVIDWGVSGFMTNYPEHGKKVLQ
ncbi:glycerophosphodiester phosphodiesterase [Evansella sp. AB-rgal1]|uniref:glycerophosphodiester phosphodiesterase n=1 Tax=Evansella sp. AB-rgal1 TaxID=3242696 RepID=UPI00359D5EED